MNDNLEICEYSDFLTNNNELNELINEYLIRSCLNVANNALFKTDYNDVKEHLFGNPNYLKVFVVEKNKKIPIIKAFLIADYLIGYKDNKVLHCHGIIVDSSIQGLGVGRGMINYLINKTSPDVVTAKTHNPRCFNTLINASNVKNYYPNNETIPTDIYKLVKTIPFISCVDDDLIYKNAYPDEKIQQNYRYEQIKEIFNKINSKDAQAIVAVLNDSKLNLKEKEYIKMR